MCYSAVIKQDLSNKFDIFGEALDTYNRRKWTQEKKVNPITQKPLKTVSETGRFFPHSLAPIFFVDAKGKVQVESAIYSAWLPPGMDPHKYSSYNARRDNLQSSFWKSAFGHHHGFMILAGFSEWVTVKDLLLAGVISIGEVKAEFEAQAEARKQKILEAGKKYAATKTEKLDPRFRNIIIDFIPDQQTDIYVPVIFNEVGGMKAFAMVTDDPLPEVASAGHDRTPIMLTLKAISDWIHPEGKTVKELDAILDQRAPVHFKHQLLKAA